MVNGFQNITWPDLPVHNINGVRFYEAPNGNKYPSITSVLSAQPGKAKGLQEWLERVGVDVAKYISMKAARRGTAFHNIVEDYLNKEDIKRHKEKNFLAYCMFGEMKEHIDNNIQLIYFLEQSMFSDDYMVAGRCDCIAEYNNKLSIIDFKTTTTMKKDEWNEDYYTQCAAYAAMFEEHTKTPIENLVIMMVAENGEVQCFEKNPADYLPKLEEMITEFYNNFNAD